VTHPAAQGKGRGPSFSGGFSPGAIVASRYRIVRFIACGGMGEVYEAEDLVLRERLALKAIRPEIARDERAVRRFRREIQLARKVTHPNVCRLFDVGFHGSSAGGSAGGSAGSAAPGAGAIPFLTMELLEGETLAERLDRTGRMTPAEALPLVEQMAAALSAAHRSGVIHHDFKSQNVMLVPAGAASRSVRVVVTDFGLARSAIEDGALPLAEGIVGTPAYMAPEQLGGGPITPAIDIHALGVVLYEMVTGVRPFEAPSATALVAMRLAADAPSPREHVADLDPVWEAVILRCLARSPEERFADALDLGRVLGGEGQRRQSPGPRSRPRWTRWLVGAAAPVLLFGLAAGRLGERWQERHEQKASPSAARGRSRPAIAVLGFKDHGGHAETAWLSTALAEMLSTELAAGEKFRIIPGETIARVKRDLALADADSLARDTLGRLHQNVGADFVVLGSYLALPHGNAGQGVEVRIDLRLQDTAGETVVLLSDTAGENELLGLVDRLGSRLRARLAAGNLSPAEASGVRASLPRGVETARNYTEGLARLRVFNAKGALDPLLRAVSAEPDFPLAHLALGETFEALGQGRQAQAELRRAFELSGRLPRAERLLVEAFYRRSSGELQKALDIRRTLFEFFPDNLEYGLELVQAEVALGRLEEAMKTVAELRLLPAPVSDDPRIDQAEATATTDFGRQLKVAGALVAKAQAMQAWGLVADGYDLRSSAHMFRGEYAEAAADAEKARPLHVAAGLHHGVTSSLFLAGTARGYLGDLGETRARLEEAAAVERQDDDSSLQYRHRLAMLYLVRGELAAARGLLGDIQASRRGREPDPSDAMYSSLIEGWLGLLAGDPVHASTALTAAAATARTIDEPALETVALILLGHLALAGDDLSSARQRYEEAVASWRRQREHSQRFWFWGWLPPAQLSLGRLELAAGRPRESEAVARAVLEQQRSLHWVLAEAPVQTLLAQAMWADGRPGEAEAAVTRAVTLAERTGILPDQVAAAVVAARLCAASGRADDVAAAMDRLKPVLAAAQRAGLRGEEFESRLALGQIEWSAGLAQGRAQGSAQGRAQGPDRLMALAREARAAGYLRIARQAQEAYGERRKLSGSR
jgi:tetratricopeptide (TPR) repeat protein/TolB-like protein